MMKALAVSAKFFKTWFGRFLFEYHFSRNNYMLRHPPVCNLSFPTYMYCPLTKENKCKKLRSKIFPHLSHFPAGSTRFFPFFLSGSRFCKDSHMVLLVVLLFMKSLFSAPGTMSGVAARITTMVCPGSYSKSCSPYSTVSPLSLVGSTISWDIPVNTPFT